MFRSAFIKIITLLIFVSLLISFLLYRTGSFNRNTSDKLSPPIPPPSAILAANMMDTFPPESDSQKRLRLASSKVLILNDYVPSFFDSIFRLPKFDVRKKKRQEKVFMMSGSKSGFIVKPVEYEYLRISADSVNFDTTIKTIRRIP